MAKRVKPAFLCILLTLCLLCGCANGEREAAGERTEEGSATQDGTLSICAGQRYRFALQQIISHINLSENGLTLTWTDDMEEADVIITDNIPPEKLKQFQVIPTEKLSLQGISQLAVTDERGTVGLPLFLRMDSFWYDEYFYTQQEIAAPQSLDSWHGEITPAQYPAVCDETDMQTVFWGVIAPLYLTEGGTAAELSDGSLRSEYLLPALLRLETLVTDGLLRLSTDARAEFTENLAAFWLAGVDYVSESYHYMSNLSSWLPSMSLLFPAEEQAVCVVRAEFLAVRNTVDDGLAERFLKLFFDQQTAADLSSYVRMPMACQMSYAPDTVPELPRVCYTALSSPMVEVAYVACGWDSDRQEQVYSALLALMQGQTDAVQAAAQLTK